MDQIHRALTPGGLSDTLVMRVGEQYLEDKMILKRIKLPTKLSEDDSRND